ncbi:hypothetical protein HDU93_006614, partial [Gonapodya sp. JEL0774]
TALTPPPFPASSTALEEEVVVLGDILGAFHVSLVGALLPPPPSPIYRTLFFSLSWSPAAFLFPLVCCSVLEEGVDSLEKRFTFVPVVYGFLAREDMVEVEEEEIWKLEGEEVPASG